MKREGSRPPLADSICVAAGTSFAMDTAYQLITKEGYMGEDVSDGILEVLMRIENAILFLKMNPLYFSSGEGSEEMIAFAGVLEQGAIRPQRPRPPSSGGAGGLRERRGARSTASGRNTTPG
jgi:hypothetical protein